MEIPATVSDKFFERDFVRGSVLATEMQFEDGARRQKYLVILNHNPSEDETLFFLTTSKVDFYEKHPSIQDYVRVEAGQITFFPLVTIIKCREVHAIARLDLKKRYQEGKLRFLGKLPADVMQKINGVVASSRFISLKHKKIILGWS